MAGGQVERALSITASDEITEDEQQRLLMLRLGGGAVMGLQWRWQCHYLGFAPQPPLAWLGQPR